MTAAQRLVQSLLAHGVTHVFCVPGESFLAILDALWDQRDRIDVITCRHEAAAANMATAHGKLTGRPGVCMVTRGPGATHAATGVHTARQDSAPMILIVGQVARPHLGREAFQELDYPAVFGTMAKWAVQIDDPDRIDEILNRAFATAVQGRAGPVVISTPEDMLRQPTTASPAPPPAAEPARAAPTPAFLAALETRLAAAERPIAILGGSGWTAEALTQLTDWAGRAGLPIALSFRRKDLVDNHNRAYAGDIGLSPNPKLVQRLRASDLVIALGARLTENATQGYTLFTPEQTAERLVHIHPDPNELGRVWPAALTACADTASAAEALAAIALPADRWRDWGDAAHADARAFAQPLAVTGQLNLSLVFQHLAETLPPDAIVCNGAGNYAAWLHRFYRHRQFATQLAPTSGAMGFGFPAAIAAKLTHPDREVVAVAGDGCFLMCAQELATAVQHKAAMTILVIDNGAYGTIRMHQARDYPGHTIATDLTNPDFVALAKAFGAWGRRVETTAEFPEALQAARESGGVALLHLVTDLEDIAPGRRLSEMGAG
jgi:acetolactate synthase I/II/III large subunit